LCTVDSAGTAFAEADSLVYRTTYTYSANSRRVKARIAGPDGRRHTFRLRYDDAGRLTRFIYPDGSRISYRYDEAGELASVILPDALEFTPQAAEEAPAVEHYRRDDPYNWTRRTRIEPSGDATLTERSFEYYGM
ncbi:MAG: RHS repeat protein, partial [Bacteroidales bacterium]|nr:RHS repeat protein [Bacteroidales bacterium]